MKFLRNGLPFLFVSLSLVGIESRAQQSVQTGPASPSSPPLSLPSPVSPSISAIAPSYPPVQISDAQRAAIRRMLVAFHSEEMALYGMKIGLNQAKQKDPGLESYLSELFAKITPAQLVDKMVPAYARYYSREEADAIADFLITPVGVKFVTGMVKDITAGKEFSIATMGFTPAEIVTLADFFKTPPAQKIGKVQPMINLEVQAIMRTWGQELIRASIKKSLTPLANQIDQDLASQGVAPGNAAVKAPPVSAEQSKIWSAVSAIGVATSKNAAEARQRYQNDVLTSGAKMSLSAAGLTSADSIATSKKSVQFMGDSLDRYLQSYDEILTDARTKITALDIPAGLKEPFLKGFDIGLSRSYDERIRYGENQRALLSLYQRLFDFSEARLGKISVVDNKLVFADPADQEIYRTIIGQIVAEGARETALVKESQDRIRAASANIR